MAKQKKDVRLSGETDDYALEKQFLHKDGRPIWTYVAVSVVRDERSGEPLYMIAGEYGFQHVGG